MAASSRARRVTRAGVRLGALVGALAGAGAWAQATPASAPSSPGGGPVRVFHPPGCHGPESAAVDRLMAQVRRGKLYAWAKPGCIDQVVDRCTASVVEVSLYEHHDARCGGDPLTEPRIDSFRVHRSGGRIDWLSPMDDDWRPFERIHAGGYR